MKAEKKELNDVFQAKVARLCVISNILAINGFFTSTDMNIYRLDIRIHCDSINEIWQAYNLLCNLKATWKEREVKSYSRNDGSKYYVIELKF